MISLCALLFIPEFTRDLSAKLKAIQLNGITVCKVKVNQNRELAKFTDWNNVTTEYSYEVNTGLIDNKKTSRGMCGVLIDVCIYFYRLHVSLPLAHTIFPSAPSLSPSPSSPLPPSLSISPSPSIPLSLTISL